MSTAAPLLAHVFESTAGDDDEYVETAHAALTDALRTATAQMAEPRVADPPHAVRVLDRVTETLVGFAIGTVASEVLRVVRIWFNDEVAAATRRGLRADWPAVLRGGGGLDLSPKYLADADARPLVDMLARRLYVAFCLASRDVRVLLDVARNAIERHAPNRVRQISPILAELAPAETIEDRVGAELVFGWQVYSAAITDRPFPSTEGRSARSRSLWEAWRAQLVGRVPAPRTSEQASGYIVLVR